MPRLILILLNQTIHWSVALPLAVNNYHPVARLTKHRWTENGRNASQVWPTRCNVTQFIYFCKLLYMFRVIYPPIIRSTKLYLQHLVFVKPLLLDCIWNVMAHAQKQYFVFRRNRRFHLNWRGRQFIRLLAVELCASAVVMLGTPCSEVVCRVLATHSIRKFPLHFPSRASPCAITFQLDSTCRCRLNSSTIAASSSKGLTNTRCCGYSCMCSWWWVGDPPETCRLFYRNK